MTVVKRVPSALIFVCSAALMVGCHDRKPTDTQRGGDAGSDSSDPGNGGAAQQPPNGTTAYTLYHLGMDAQSTVYTVAVDNENVYWAGASITQAPKSGGGERVVLATSAGGIFVIRTDADFVYWVGGGQPYRTPKHRKGLAGATFQPVELGGISLLERTQPAPEYIASSTYPVETLLLDGSFMYVAAPGCAEITRVDLSTRAQQTVKPQAAPVTTTGRTYLVKSSAELYCGAWHGVFRVGESAMEALTDSAARIAGMAVSGGSLYWVDKLSNSSTDSSAQVWSLDAQGKRTKVADVLNSSGVSEIYADEPRQRLVWVDTALTDFSIESGAFRVWKYSSFNSGGSARDDDFLYWTRSTGSFGTIERIRLDEP